MNIQEAFNLGLDKAEDDMISKFEKLLTNEDSDPCINPKLEKLRIALQMQLKYVNDLANKKKSNVGKYAKRDLDSAIDFYNN
jgi:predicted transport protein